MLVELQVENYAVVERLRVRFHAGLNLLTGETGSGKSLVVDALNLLFGGRASAETVRTGAERARISGIFELPADSNLTAILDRAGIETEDGELLLEREVQAGGKSRAFAGNRPVTVSLLRELSPYLGDIHGQHDQQRLFSPEAQLEVLDQFAGAGSLLAEVAGIHRDWHETGKLLAELDASEQERLRLADLWRFQKKEIEDASPEPGEDESLMHERLVLMNVSRLEENTSAAHTVLYESADSALAQLRQAWRSLEDAANLDESLKELRDSLQPAEIIVEETARELQHYLGRLEADPARLEAVESRLNTIEKLKRKYGTTLEEVLAFLEEVRANLAGSESTEERRAALMVERGRLEESYRNAAGRLSKKRREAARTLEKRLVSELESLAMERTAFNIEIEAAPWLATGADRVRYLVSPNSGEEPRPMEKIASGGELSRIALAIKTVTTGAAKTKPKRKTAPRTLVFDEVDAGVGGGAAETVGRRLKRISSGSQVLCVTHLPQIAGFADHHYHVAKAESKGRTVATIQELDGTERIREIGRMLSGQRLTTEALRHAEQLIKAAAG